MKAQDVFRVPVGREPLSVNHASVPMMQLRLGISFLDDRNAADSTQYHIEVGEDICPAISGVSIDQGDLSYEGNNQI
jgi:hypothetical protein